MLAPRNFSELMSMPYMDPQPPEMSRTLSSWGSNAATSRSQICDSASSRKSGLEMVDEEEEDVRRGDEVENCRATEMVEVDTNGKVAEWGSGRESRRGSACESERVRESCAK